MSNPTATIYQNESNVIIVFSPVFDLKTRIYRGASISFENHWMDGGACGSGFESKKELNEYLKENNYVKRGIIKLGNYCWSKHTVETLYGQIHGGTATCKLKRNHKSKHKGMISAGFSKPDVEVAWID